MKHFFRPNISGTGRIVRGVIAIGFLVAGLLATPLPWPVRILFFVSAGFVGFEALRGWCALRACGIRTRL